MSLPPLLMWFTASVISDVCFGQRPNRLAVGDIIKPSVIVRDTIKPSVIVRDTIKPSEIVRDAVEPIGLSAKDFQRADMRLSPVSDPSLLRVNDSDMYSLENYEGDIKLFLAPSQPGLVRSAVRDPAKLWPNATVYYGLTADFDQTQRAQLAAAILDFELGFWHEQTRTDRDDYITIVYENIVRNGEYNFIKLNQDEIQHLGESYDYYSIMHYGRTAFSSNGRDTIVPIQKDAVIGQRVGFSPADLRKINRLYKCPGFEEEEEVFCNVVGHQLNAEEKLNSASEDCLESENGQYRLVMHSHGNLVLYYWPEKELLWQSATEGRPIKEVALQSNGDLVMYQENGEEYVITYTWENVDSPRLILQNDGNLVIYTGSAKPIWSTGTQSTEDSGCVNAVRQCANDFQCLLPGSYQGFKDTTVTGKPCQRWDRQEPHAHFYLTETPHNYCRNPEGGLAPWCFTMDYETRWEFCFPSCTEKESKSNVDLNTDCIAGFITSRFVKFVRLEVF